MNCSVLDVFISSAKTLVVSFIGMTSQEVPIKQNVNVVLKSDTEVLDEVVVTGYGVTKKAAFTGAATTLGSEKIENRNDANPIKALEGTVPGLQMNISSGQPGAPATVYIRGRNSLNSGTQPLYVIDGIPFNADPVGVRSSEGQETSPLSTLSSSDIESITVLKDATATSIYGARAANGVIVITTKKGKSGKPTVNFTAKVGFETMPAYTKRYKLANAAQNVELASEALLNGYADYGDDSTFGYYNAGYGWGLNADAAGAKQFYDNYVGGWVASGIDNSWLDAVTRNGLIQEYGFDLSGGGASETAPKYYLSFNYMDEESIVIGKDLSRYSFRFNMDQAPSKFVKYGFNTNLSYTESNMGTGGGYFSDPITQAYMQNPMTPVKDANGEWNWDTVNGYNPVAQRSELGDKSTAKQYRAILSPYLQLNFTDNLFFLSRAGADVYFVDEFGYWSFLQPQGKEMRGMGENNYTTRMLLTITNTLNYINTFNEKHNVNFLIGQEGQKTHLKEAYLSGSNYPVDFLNQVSNTAVPGSASTSKYELVLGSFFANAQYDYDGKYYLSGSFRYDGSSRFGSNHRWAPFWSLGAKYRISSEKFMEDTKDWLTNLTLRASYGTSGNQEVGNTAYYSSWYTARDLFGFGYNYNNLPGSAHYQFGNPDLKWEQTDKFNVGIDVTLFERINIEMDYYRHKTKNMVFAVPTSMTTGLTSYYKNIGELSNTGFEASVNAMLLKTKDFTWDVTVTGAFNKNKVEKLSTDDPIESSIQITEVGRPIYQYKMKEYAGVDPQTGTAMWYLNAEGDETTDNYNKAAKRYLGDPNPDFSGSLSTSLKWKNLDFAVQFNYSLGAKIYGNNLHYDEQIGGSWYENYTMYVYENRWQKPGDITDVPRLTTEASYENSASSRFLMDGDYLKIRSISIGYTLPKSWTKKFFANNARIFMNAENVYTFTAKNYRGFDPAGIGANGVQWWNFPLPRNFVFGVNLGF
ncbi:SusC/RagA family TonB-linked outer membrane protein [Phocaeicola sp.]